MMHARWVCGIALVIAIAGCDRSPTYPVHPPAEPEAPPEEIAAYLPALGDVENRILPAGSNPLLLRQLSEYLVGIQKALVERKSHVARRFVDQARHLLDVCDDKCLIGPEKSVIQLTIDHAERLIGTSKQETF